MPLLAEDPCSFPEYLLDALIIVGTAGDEA